MAAMKDEERSMHVEEMSKAGRMLDAMEKIRGLEDRYTQM